jgi:hypothetical protein
MGGAATEDESDSREAVKFVLDLSNQAGNTPLHISVSRSDWRRSF